MKWAVIIIVASIFIALLFNQSFGWINLNFITSIYSEKCYIKGQEPKNMLDKNKIEFEGINGYLKCLKLKS